MRIKKADLIPPLILRGWQALKRELLQQGSTGLNQLDLKLIRAINPSRGGYFIELGANDGIRQSNTYKLQRHYGWTGLLIEPNPARFQECVRNRAFLKRPQVLCAACVPFGFGSDFIEIEDSDLMSVAKGLCIPDEMAIQHADRGRRFLESPDHRFRYAAMARSLTDLLKEVSAPSHPDLLSLDVEGNELAVLQGLDFSQHQPQWILVETRDDSVVAYLSGQGYVLHTALNQSASYADLLFRTDSSSGGQHSSQSSST
jgi:FkbM family methyltransferase